MNAGGAAQLNVVDQFQAVDGGYHGEGAAKCFLHILDETRFFLDIGNFSIKMFAPIRGL